MTPDVTKAIPCARREGRGVMEVVPWVDCSARLSVATSRAFAGEETSRGPASRPHSSVPARNVTESTSRRHAIVRNSSWDGDPHGR
jgi:hypothetical protein